MTITHYANIPLASQGYAAIQLLKSSGKPQIFICSDDKQLQQQALLAESMGIDYLTLPAWDCLPYDRISPSGPVMAERLHCLCTLASTPDTPRLILTTINAYMQRVPPREVLQEAGFHLTKGGSLNRDAFVAYLLSHGYARVNKVMEAGEFALRGNIIDCFPTGYKDAVRIDLFGDEIESLKYFEPLSQISHSTTDSITFLPVSEILLNEASIARFRENYRELFGAVLKENPLYESISEGRMAAGAEHWLPLFYPHMEVLEEYVPTAQLCFNAEVEAIFQDRLEQLEDFYAVRHETAPGETPYHPLPPRRLYRVEPDLNALIHDRSAHFLHRFDATAAQPIEAARALKALPNLQSTTQEDRFSVLRSMLDRPHPLVVACYSDGSRDRVSTMLKSAGFDVTDAPNLQHLPKQSALIVTVLPIEFGFESAEFTLISEQDLLGERIIRTQKRKQLSEHFIAEASILEPGELIVHAEHGIGRFDSLQTLEVNGVTHDCLKLVYAGDDKLFLPVVNMDIISRFGQEGEGVQLDKLGSVAWQKRKAAMKQRIKLAAEQLLKLAARRATREAPELIPTAEDYERFCNRFPYTETDDQLKAIDEVLADLATGKPTDRLICGDVGFGKTEVAMRAAFAALKAQSGGVQVAVVAPTTLLARQHHEQFRKRFEGFGIEVGLLSRMVTPKQQEKVKEGLANGSVQLVIGTH
ncbi:MAG: transcription-repair coupling factor, partial [Rickettsiales bacterium]|nr:transcription-repair coupling factor [Rickettsiales bacterium]